jgi:hypothetical protein
MAQYKGQELARWWRCLRLSIPKNRRWRYFFEENDLVSAALERNMEKGNRYGTVHYVTDITGVQR